MDIAIVIGPTKRTVVTLSRHDDSTAVIMTNITIIFHGSAFTSFADLIATYSNIPDSLITATNSIIPTSTPMVLKSTYSRASSKLKTFASMSTAAPTRAAAVRCTLSVVIKTITPKKTKTVKSPIYFSPNKALVYT